MRSTGEHLAEVEALIARVWERRQWRARQAKTIDAEILRRALDMPFFGDLVRAAWRVGPDADLSPPDFRGTPWEHEGEVYSRTSDSRPQVRDDLPVAPPGREAEAPARLRAAERALQDRTRSLVPVLDDLVGARNASAVVRTSEALGLQEVHLVQREGRVALERTVTLHAERWLDLHWYARAEEMLTGLRDRGYRVWVADYAKGALPLVEIPVQDRMAVVFGSEQKGVSEEVRRQADGFFFLPSSGFTSYVNVSVMAGVTLHSLDARMRSAGVRTPLDARDLARLRKGWYATLAKGNPARASEYRHWLERSVSPAPPRSERGESRDSTADRPGP